jgi:DNA-binding NarL/FixJ family response regulator
MAQSSIHVLLVEDDPGYARLFQELLADTGEGGFEVAHVDRLERAFTRLEKEAFELMLLDLSLPDSCGLETVIRARAAVPDLAIVVLTSLDDESMAMEAARLGAQDYLVKGQIEGRTLVRSMRYALERKSLQREQEELIRQLQEALATVKKLSGLLPICASCKNIRDDKGYWNQIEKYIHEHAEVDFTHSICPDCMRKLYPQYAKTVASGARLQRPDKRDPEGSSR